MTEVIAEITQVASEGATLAGTWDCSGIAEY